MAMLPEEFPVVLTVYMAMGAWRISRARVLTRRAAAIETLGSATVLCTDKTGTLTENRMRVGALVAPDGAAFHAPIAGVAAQGLSEDLRELASFAALASAPEPSDPMEKALHAFADERAPRDERNANAHALHKTYSLRPDLLAMSNVWRPADGEPIEDRGQRRARSHRETLQAGRAGGARASRRPPTSWRARACGFWASPARNFTADAPCGADTISSSRSSALSDWSIRSARERRAAVDECRTAGVRVIMITGDYPQTALAIARAAGIAPAAPSRATNSRR